MFSLLLSLFCWPVYWFLILLPIFLLLALLIIRTDRSDMMSGTRGGPVKMQKMLIELMVLLGWVNMKFVRLITHYSNRLNAIICVCIPILGYSTIKKCIQHHLSQRQFYAAACHPGQQQHTQEKEVKTLLITKL